MSVRVSKRNENQTLKTLLLTMDLAYYTVKICCNENVFLPKYRNMDKFYKEVSQNAQNRKTNTVDQGPRCS